MSRLSKAERAVGVRVVLRDKEKRAVGMRLGPPMILLRKSAERPRKPPAREE